VKEPLSGIEELRGAVRLFSNCNETFNQRYTAEQLLQLYRAYKLCRWDFTPDRWHPKQVFHAISLGVVPEWNEHGEPIVEEDPKPSTRRFATTHD
jgi:hypothetical protein